MHTGDLLDALNNGIVSKYATDFPNDVLLNHENVIPIPHLSASTRNLKKLRFNGFISTKILYRNRKYN